MKLIAYRKFLVSWAFGDATRIFVKDTIVWAFLEGNEIKRRIIGGGDVALVLA